MDLDLDARPQDRDWIKPRVDVAALAREGITQGEIVRRVAVEHRCSISEATEHVTQILRRLERT
jgi:hypothetical protein